MGGELEKYMQRLRYVRLIEAFVSNPNRKFSDIAKENYTTEVEVSRALRKYFERPTQPLYGINSGIDTPRAIKDNRYKIKDVRNKEHYFVLDIELLKQNT